MQDAILIVDDDQDILTAGRLLLRRHYGRVDTCADPHELPARLRARRYSAILLDMNFGPGESSGAEGLIWLRAILEEDADAVVVLITAHGGVDTAVEAMKLGATDFITKPWQNEKLVATLSASVQLSRTRAEARRLQQTNNALVAAAQTQQSMLGNSSAMRSTHTLIERAAPTQANVLILGENGTGKELAARAIHASSARSEAIFMSVDLGAVSESLFESELFGHIKGAFTDAKADRIGRLQAANSGTLFLDEIGNLPLHLQAKLLSVLETQQVTPVGSSQAVKIDVRFVAATNMPRDQLMDDRRFRQDLLFRLNTVEITLPPLRERAEDIVLLATHFAENYARKYGREPKRLSDAAARALTDYSWPGNIRALRHAMERAVILSDGVLLEPKDFILEESAAASRSPSSGKEATAEHAELNLAALERSAIASALTKHRYNISHAAKTLGLTRAALYRRMEKHGL